MIYNIFQTKNFIMKKSNINSKCLLSIENSLFKNIYRPIFISNLNKSFRNFSENYQNHFRSSDVQITQSKKPTYVDLTNPDNLLFGKTPTDHMIRIHFDGEKWQKATISPFQNIKVNPFNSTIHYAISCFEGMKAYKGVDGKIRLICPHENIYQLKRSMLRIGMDEPWSEDEQLKLMCKLIKIDEKWFPTNKFTSLYVRSIVISMGYSCVFFRNHTIFR